MSNKPIHLAFDQISRDRNGNFVPCDAAREQYRRNRRMAKDQVVVPSDPPTAGACLEIIETMVDNLPPDEALTLLESLKELAQRGLSNALPASAADRRSRAIDNKRASYRPAQDARPRSTIDIRDIAPGIDRIEIWKLR